MRYIAIVLVFLRMTVECHSQNNYPVIFESPFDERISSLIETNNHDILSVGLRCQGFHLIESFQGMIWKVSSELDTLSQSYQWSDTSCQFNYIEELPNSEFRIIGLLYNPPDYQNSDILILTLDSNLNVLNRSIISLGNVGLSSHKVKKINNNYYILGQFNYSSYEFNPFIIKLDQNMILVNSCELDSLSGYFTDVLEHGNELWCFSDAMDSQIGSEMIILDDAMNIESINQLPYDYDYETQSIVTCYKSHTNTEWYTDSSFIVFSNQLQTYHINEIEKYTAGFSILDSSLSIQPITHIGDSDTMEHVAYQNALDVDSDLNIYYYSIKNNEISLFPMDPSWIRIGKLNSNLEPIYEITYGGDSFYRGIEIKKTNDGGCIVSALKYNHNFMDYQWDVVFFKVDSLGIITNNDNILIDHNVSFGVFPNPCSESITTTLQEDGVINIIDLYGKTIQTHHLKEGKQSINISNIKSGLYILKFVSFNNTIKTKKILKL